MSRVVVTGLGAVTPAGLSANDTFNGVLAGKSFVRKTSHPRIVEDERYEVRIAAEIGTKVDAAPILGFADANRHARFTQLAAVATLEAVEASGLRSAGYARERMGCIIGVGLGGLEMIETGMKVLAERGPLRVSPFGIPAMIANMAAGAISAALDVRGPSYCVSSACASGAHAIGDALLLLRQGVVDAVICGGAESALGQMAFSGFAKMRALSMRNDEPERASRPFDRDRDGFVLSEGTGILILEREDDAKRRGAPIIAELAGYAATSDAHHPTSPAPDGRGALAAMQMAIADAKLTPEAVSYVNAHGTATKPNDLIEGTAIRKVFGAHAETLPVTSTKGAIGHMLGATGAVEALICALAVSKGMIPPNVNLDHPDPEIPLSCLPTTAREQVVDVALSNSFGFGGHNTSLVLRRWRG